MKILEGPRKRKNVHGAAEYNWLNERRWIVMFIITTYDIVTVMFAMAMIIKVLKQ